MKFGQLVDYKIRSNFLEKSYSKTPFGKIKIEHISGTIVCSKLQNTCLYLILSFFLKKTKAGLELVSLSYFLYNF